MEIKQPERLDIKKLKDKHNKATTHIRNLKKKNEELSSTILLMDENRKNIVHYWKNEVEKLK